MLAVGTALREAQASMSGEELRSLTRQRRQLTAAVTTQARRTAREEGTKVTDAVADQVEATLTAAMVDERCALAVRSGMLVAALATTGLDPADVAGSVAVPEALGFTATAREAAPAPRAELHVVPDPEADQKAIAAAEELLAALSPQMSASVRGAFLDQVARTDRLTGAASRRVLEARPSPELRDGALDRRRVGTGGERDALHRDGPGRREVEHRFVLPRRVVPVRSDRSIALAKGTSARR